MKRFSDEEPQVDLDENEGEVRDHKKRGVWGSVREILLTVVIALAVSIVIKTFLFRAFVIPSTSMQNTLLVNDRVFVNQLFPQPFKLERGNVIVFKDEEKWLPELPEAAQPNAFEKALTFVGLRPDDGTQHLIKRIIGLPGDTVECCTASGKISVNGVEITEPYLYPGDKPSEVPFKVTVPKDHLWVLGDHRSDSGDSRYHTDKNNGMVSMDSVVGRADFIAWPLDRWGGVANPEGAFDAVPDREPKE
ncbi:signal peptidase I [Pseudoglutamicibacter cumminsii]|uniref:signal peptidase I n=1 Tax=Pseudoglutamicibacter cumminsii TaxID=156979 RepID=UPI0021A3688D|nr:signal peptidase I [Pseudoglutamicibacter cumminsii]MCT1686827.1 signal peptidase I [Pseudoglutamicibacter cumminsii]